MKFGFTLIEILVVLTIIFFLITISIITVRRYKLQAVNIRVSSTLIQVRNVAGMIFTDNSSYNSIYASGTINDADPRLKVVKEDVVKFSYQNPVCYAQRMNYCV